MLEVAEVTGQDVGARSGCDRSLIHRGLAPKLFSQAWLDEFNVSAVPEIRKDVGVCCRFDVARVVGAWSGDVPESAGCIWEPIPAGRPVGCSGVRSRREDVFAKFVDFDHRGVGAWAWNVTLSHDVLRLYSDVRQTDMVS